ncbi:MAG: GNAT family N-acetyltransferase [Bacteroidetes bacterium]|nr:GNAT family N-acetyltransferase [Bacteroidota bacterium]
MASPDDIPIVVDIHFQSLSEDYLPRLGKKVMLGYYNILVKDNYVILFEEEKCIAGFLALSICPMSLKIIFNKYYKIILKKLLLQPDLWAQSLWLAFCSKRNEYDYPEISFIAIDKKYRRTSIGSQLITWVCNFISKRGIEYLQVKTELNNTLANNFYKKNRFNVVSLEKRFDRKFNIYLREVKSGNS